MKIVSQPILCRGILSETVLARYLGRAFTVYLVWRSIYKYLLKKGNYFGQFC
jgi:hypothetical protein